MNYFGRKISLIATGQIGYSVIAAVVLGLCHQTFESSVTPFMLPVAVLVLVRLIHCQLMSPKALLSDQVVKKSFSELISCEAVTGSIFVATCFLADWSYLRLTLGVFLLANFLLQLTWMYISIRILASLAKRSDMSHPVGARKQAIIIGTGPRARQLADKILNSPELETGIMGFLDYRRQGFWRYRDIPLLGHPRELERIASRRHMDVLMMAVEPEDIAQTIESFRTAEEMGVTVCVLPDIYGNGLYRPQSMLVNGTSAMVYRAVPEDRFGLMAKGITDRVGAFAGLLLLTPLMIATALLVKLDTKGSIFFKQVRSGLNGKRFWLYKFRTMCDNAEEMKKDLKNANEMSGPVFKITEDPRVTRVGRILRKLSIDELPQLFNVLRGDMSLVGPRPPLPEEVEQYEPWQRRRLSVKPGVTCIWQVSGRNQVDFDQWMRLDLQYIDNWSYWQDAKLLARTVPAVIKGDGAS